MTRNRRAGFTLIEMMLVVGIIGLIAALAVSSMERANRKKSVEQQISEIYAHVGFTRALAEVGGPALGTPNYQHCVTINGAAQVGPYSQDLSIVFDINANTITRPTRVRFNPAAAWPPRLLQSDCERLTVPATLELEGGGCVPANGRLAIAFTGLGRAYPSSGPPAAFQDQCGVNRFRIGVCLAGSGCIDTVAPSPQVAAPAAGVRVLPSGVICRSGSKGIVECDQDF